MAGARRPLPGRLGFHRTLACHQLEAPGRTAQTHPVDPVFRRVMAAGDGHTCATAGQHRGEVHQRRGHHADVDQRTMSL